MTQTSPVADVTADQRARVIVVVTMILGAMLLAATINVERSSALFVVAGLALAMVWTLGFWLASGGQPNVTTRLAPEAAAGIAIGGTMFGVFVAGAWLAGRIDILQGPIDDILQRADQQALAWVIVLAAANAVAEELFFRGALMDAFSPHRAVVSSAVLYVIVTAAGANVALAIAAAVMGPVFAIERRVSGALIAPIATHLTWSLLMILAFPRP